MLCKKTRLVAGFSLSVSACAAYTAVGQPGQPPGDAAVNNAESQLISADINRLDVNAFTEMDPWEALTGAIVDAVDPRGEMPGLQVLSVPMRAAWNHPKYGDYYAWRVLSDSKPTWTFVYQSSPVSLASSYEFFLRSLAVKAASPDALAKIDRSRRQIEDLSREYQALYERHIKDWQRFNTAQQALPEDRRKTYGEWLAITFQTALGASRERIRVAAQNYFKVLNESNPDFLAGGALLKFYDEQHQRHALAPDGTSLLYRTYNITPSLQDFVDAAVAGGQAGVGKLDFTINKSSTRFKMNQSRWSAGGGFSFGFFSIGGGGGRQTLRINSKSDRFALSFKSSGYQRFTISPGGWFDGAVVSAYKDGPWVAGGPVADRRVELWGSNGVFNMMPRDVFVVWRPVIKVTMTEAEYALAKSSWSAGGSVGIGCFSFGGRGGGSAEEVKFDDAGKTITLEDRSNEPQIVAIVSRQLPDFK